MMMGSGSGGGEEEEEEFPMRYARVPQWGLQETRDFIRIRAELERDFSVSRKNKKMLWESVSIRMKEEFGYKRTADRCKSKWKNLITRYKQQEKIEMNWKELIEKHVYERQVFEQEWRSSMEKIERERFMAEQAWRERNEQRKLREERRVDDDLIE